MGRFLNRPPSVIRQMRAHERAGEYRPLPDRDKYVQDGIQGTNPNTPIIVPADWPGFDGLNHHLHAPADSTRPDGWLMPPMEPTPELGGGYRRYFFDGASGAFPFDLWDWGWRNPEQFLERLGVAMSAIDACSNVLASMPVYGVNREAETFRLPEWHINPDPTMYESWVEFAQTMFVSLLSRGEAILWATARYADGYPSRFVVLNSSWVSVSSDGNGGREFWLGGDKLDRRDVLHIRYKAAPGELRGIGPLAWMARQIVGANLLEDYVTNVAQYGVPAILTSPSAMNAGQAADLKRRWLAARQSPGEPAVLSGGITYTDGGGVSPADLAALAMVQSNEAKIVAAICSTPPYIVGVEQPGGSMTYSNLHNLTAAWWRIGLRPLAAKVMQAMSGWLLPRGQTMELNRDEFIRPADPAMLAQYYSTMANIRDGEGFPALTVNEIRVAERFVPHTESSAPGSHPDVDPEQRFADAAELTGERQ